METEHGVASEAPTTERVGNRWATPTPPRHVSTLPEAYARSYDVNPDGRLTLVAPGESTAGHAVDVLGNWSRLLEAPRTER